MVHDQDMAKGDIPLKESMAMAVLTYVKMNRLRDQIIQELSLRVVRLQRNQ